MLVELILIGNPKTASSKVFVAKIDNDKLTFLRAALPRFERGRFVGGKYELSDGYYIIKRDESSWKHSRQVYELVRVSSGKLEKIASIIREDRNLSFYPDMLEDIYIKTRNIIETLIQYAKI